MTGFYRDGYCRTGAFDEGVHVVCVQVTEEFLEYSQSVGNDLSTPVPEYDFPGLQPGDCWCLCASRWQQAFEDGMAPKVKLSATHSSAIEFMDLADLQARAALVVMVAMAALVGCPPLTVLPVRTCPASL